MSEKTSGVVKIRLGLMMLLQFFIWGVWYVPMWPYLGELGVSEANRGVAYAATGVAAMVSPFFVGMIADRFLPTQIVLGIMHLLGGLFLYLAADATTWESFYPLILGHLLCYMPTLALANSVLFQGVKDPQRDAPPLRTLGTIGWIVSGVVVGSSFLFNGELQMRVPEFLGGEKAPDGWVGLGITNWPLLIGAYASFALGIYSFSLPHTAPQLKGKQVSLGDLIGLRALGLMKSFSFTVFIVGSLLLCIPLAFYFQTANGFLKTQGVSNSEGVMTLGQVSEIFFLLLIPFFFRKLGVKWMLMIGMAAWVLRYVLFANASESTQYLLFIGVLLHGICYDFFFFTGQLYVDKKAPREVRSSAQGFIAFVTLGVGMFIGGILNGWWNEKQKGEDGVMDWAAVWYFPAIMAGVVMIAFLLLFKEDRSSEES